MVLTAMFFIMFCFIACNYYRIAFAQEEVRAAQERSELTVSVGEIRGTIYDRDMQPLTNCDTSLKAVAVPNALDREDTAAYAIDKATFYEAYDEGEPFVFECEAGTPDSVGLTVFEIPERYSADETASHLIGYLSDGKGADGIEYAYDSILRSDNAENSVTYNVDGFGRILIGDGKRIVRSEPSGGVVTTIDIDFQRICEKYGAGIKRGAIVLADIKTGDILAMASFPSYSQYDIESAISDERLPLLNRNLYSYSVGSVFKLVTAAEAINEGYSEYMYDCSGSINIDGQYFNCHKLSGHELQTMTEAMTNSCNTYFISLSRNFDIAAFRRLANALGFGKENYLCAGITGSAGVLPTVKELMIPAELANFSFGQGKLTATPLQITQLTCAIANDGKMPVLRLIKGITVDGSSTSDEKIPQISQVLDPETSHQLKKMMILAIRNNEDSNAKTQNTTVAAKTSTAQTGHLDENGDELYNGWITGFFPARKPKYALTVLVEDGGYGNDCAAPVFREVADSIAALEK